MEESKSKLFEFAKNAPQSGDRKEQIFYFKNIGENKAERLFDAVNPTFANQIVCPNGTIWFKNLGGDIMRGVLV